MSTNGIKVFCRVRPSKKPFPYLNLNMEHNQVEYEIPVDLAPGIVNNTKSSYKFKFDGIFDMASTQEEVFTRVAKEACDNALDGYNATIFAYGQTGSGKTFTITGGAERYQDRGIIPRALTYMYNEFKRRKDQQFNVYVSYLEIYNEAGYDLLDPSQETKSLEELPRVSLMEDDMGNVHLKNLSLHHAANDAEALELLFMGDTNRAISETPMNMASSRSHCIFTVSIESRFVGSDTVRRSKLHLVDLAGSERVHKTHATGQLLREAAHINKSLHFLELVITTLAEKKSDAYVPYRNSMMTNVLRDSLGGNCKTVMIATMNPEEAQLGESISTCRFSQRVACVKNSAIVNEETDPILVIRRLKAEVSALKSEIAFLKGEQGEELTLSEDDEAALYSIAKAWVQSSDDTVPLDIGAFNSTRIHCAFRMLRKIAKEGGGGGGDGGHSAAPAAGGSGGSTSLPPSSRAPEPAQSDHALASEVKQLRAQLHQRDNEIAILVNMVKQAGAGARPPLPGAPPTATFMPPVSHSPHDVGGRLVTPPVASVGAMLASGDVIDIAILEDRERAMDHFMSTYPKAQAINDNKTLLKEKYTSAKALADRVNSARDSINRIKKAIEVRRMERAVHSVAELKDADSETVAAAVAAMPPDEEEMDLKAEMDVSKKTYHEAFATLKETKAEIERIQRVFEAGKLRMHADFESWLSNSLARAKIGPPPQLPSVAMGSSTRRSMLPPVQTPPDGSLLPTNPSPIHVPGGSSLSLPVMAPAHTPMMVPMMMPMPARPGMPLMPQGPIPSGYAPQSVPGYPQIPTVAAPPRPSSSTAEADIAAFYQAREAMLRRGGMK